MLETQWNDLQHKMEIEAVKLPAWWHGGSQLLSKATVI